MAPERTDLSALSMGLLLAETSTVQHYVFALNVLSCEMAQALKLHGIKVASVASILVGYRVNFVHVL